MELQDDRIDLRRYLAVAVRWWWIILLLPLAVGGGAYIYSKAQTKTYEASALLLVQQSQTATPTLGDLQTSQRLAATYEQLITTRPILEQVATELGFTDVQGNPNIQLLEGNVGASTIDDTQILRIEARNSDPIIAADIANSLALVFRDQIQINILSGIARLQTLATQQGVAGSTDLLESQLAAIGSITVVESAVAPDSPVSPKVVLNTALGAILGLLLGVLIAYLMEAVSNTVRSPEQVEETLFRASDRAPSKIGILLRWRSKEVPGSSLVVQEHPSSIHAEMFRQVRTGFNFAIAPGGGKAFLITSAAPSEGKTTVVANLATALAQGGAKVIALESELRHPTMLRIFNNFHSGDSAKLMGLSDYLAGATDDLPILLQETNIPNLHLLPSGTVPPNPADLLNSSRMSDAIRILNSECDILLLDSPPVLPTADPVILARHVDGVVFVVVLGETRPDSFNEAIQRVSKSGTPILGYILNKVKESPFGNYSRYQYYYPNRHEQATNGHRALNGRREALISSAKRLLNLGKPRK